MALSKDEKQTLVSSYRTSEKDTGSTEVQVALLTKKIKKLSAHMAANKHDYSSYRGLTITIAKRKKLLNYLKKSDYAKYEELVKKIGDIK